MKNHFKFASLLLLGVSLSFVSCGDDIGDTDTTKPTIVVNAPTSGAVLYAGSDVHFDMELSDDVALGSYKVDIHNADDGHTHASFTKSEAVSFTYGKSWDDVAGQRNAHVHHHEIVIPENAKPGKYHFAVYCLDAAKNEQAVYLNIEIAEGDGTEQEDEHEHQH